MQRVGYKGGILMGLAVWATGTILFIPAASVRIYGFFLFALFVMACGQSVLEVAANPYVTTLGPVCPWIMGRISDASNIQRAFVVPLICHAYVFYFVVSGSRPA